MNNIDFENAVVKLQSGREGELTAREKTAVSMFSKEAVANETQLNNDDEDDVGYALRILKNAESNKRARINRSK